MSQQDIMDYLKKHPKKWFTHRELAEGIGVNTGNITMSSFKLRKFDFVHWVYEPTLIKNTRHCALKRMYKLKHKP